MQLHGFMDINTDALYCSHVWYSERGAEFRIVVAALFWPITLYDECHSTSPEGCEHPLQLAS